MQKYIIILLIISLPLAYAELGKGVACIEEDDGENPDVFSDIYLVEKDENILLGSDSCHNLKVVEYSCTYDDPKYPNVIPCGNNKVCINKQCVDQEEVDCEEFKTWSTFTYKRYSEDIQNTCFGDEVVKFSCDETLDEPEVISCEEGYQCKNGLCVLIPIIDRDGDGIPEKGHGLPFNNLKFDQCYDTPLKDPVDKRFFVNDELNSKLGCSCNQGADKVEVIIDYKEEYYECTYLKNAKWQCLNIENNNNPYPGHCCNGIYEPEKEELLTDCGGMCKKCTDLFCEPIVENKESKLDIVFMPIGYSSNSNEKIVDNYNEWIIRSAIEAFKLSTTPPFCESADLDLVLSSPIETTFQEYSKCNGEAELNPESEFFGTVIATDISQFVPMINIWRIDIFNFDEQFEKYRETEEIGGVTYTTSVDYHDFVEYNEICSAITGGVDVVYFLDPSSNPESRSHAYDLNEKKVVYLFNSDKYENQITHETGHQLCNLIDEYIEDDKTGDYSFINCEIISTECSWNEQKPFLNQLFTKSEVDPNSFKGRWINQFPDLPVPEFQFDIGCESGCFYSNKYYRATYPFENSLMNTYPEVGIGNYGIGRWNLIGYAACKSVIDSYMKE